MQVLRAVTGASLLVTLALAGCMGVNPPGGTGREVVWTTSTIGDPESLDPAYDYETAGGQVIQNVYETLVYYKGSSLTELEPILVTEVPTRANGGISEDGKTFTFRLKPNVKFHDGTTMSAADVKYSLDRVVITNDPHSPAWILANIAGASDYMASEGTAQDRQAYLTANGVQVVDPQTVRITLDKADAGFLYKLAFNVASIVSSTAFKAAHQERAATWGAAQTDDGLPPPLGAAGVPPPSPPPAAPPSPPPSPPPGTGNGTGTGAGTGNGTGNGSAPLEQTAEGATRVTRDAWADTHAVGTGPFLLERWSTGTVVLKKFAEYHGATKPRVDRVVIEKDEDLNSRILKLQERRADDIYVAVSDLQQVQGKDFVRMQEDPSLTVGVMLMTQHITNNDECPVDARSNQRDCDFFADIHMRKVFAHAFDHQRFVRDVAQGHVIQLPSAVPKGMVGFDETLRPYSKNDVLARAELALSQHPNGFKMNLYYNSGNALREGAAQLMKQGLEALHPGIEVNVQALDWATAMLPQGKNSALAAYFIGWAPDFAFPENYVVPFGDRDAGNYALWADLRDGTLEQLIDQAAEATEQAEVLDLYKQVQRHMNTNYTFLWLYQTNNVHVEGTWTCGYVFNPMDSGQPNVGQYKFVGKDAQCQGQTQTQRQGTDGGDGNATGDGGAGTGTGTGQAPGNATGNETGNGTGGNGTGGP